MFLNGNGGIIYCYNIICKMKLNNCIFYKCCCDSNGGAIYLSCFTNGTNVELNRICASNCFTNINQFSFISTFHSADCNNSAIFLSINNCNFNDKNYISYYLSYGNMYIKNFNSSKNFNKEISTISISRQNIFEGIFWTIVDNIVTEDKNVMLNGNYINILSFCNIINNISPLDNGVITIWYGSYIIDNCIFLNNKNTLFYVHKGELNINNCFINLININSHKGIINLNNYSLINNINTLILNHYSTIHCNINNFQNTFQNQIYHLNIFKYFLILLFFLLIKKKI